MPDGRGGLHSDTVVHLEHNLGMRAQKGGQKAGFFEVIVVIQSLEAHFQKQVSRRRARGG